MEFKYSEKVLKKYLILSNSKLSTLTWVNQYNNLSDIIPLYDEFDIGHETNLNLCFSLFLFCNPFY